uniref:Cyanate hydratase n=1 Tax=Mycena chlorophos TaxID=658473 RepID=A0ABQ0LM85_MYCCL|nr:ATP-binding cassette transporter [Mycena chlorophos]
MSATISSNNAPYSELQAANVKLFEAKARKGVTFDDIAKAIGKDEIWVAAAFYGQAKFTSEELAQVSQFLGIDHSSLDAELGAHWWPSRGLGPMPPNDPVLYRLYEGVLVYGHAIKAVIHEKFGDGIMSMIDCTISVTKKEHPKGDRVVLTFDGKFLPYAKWHNHLRLKLQLGTISSCSPCRESCRQAATNHPYTATARTGHIPRHSVPFAQASGMDFWSSIPQLVLPTSFLGEHGHTDWNQYLLNVPTYVAAFSACILLAQALLTLPALRRVFKDATAETCAPFEPAIGCGHIWAWRMARVVACVILVGVSISASLDEHESEEKMVEGAKKEMFDLGLMNGPYVYATLLALPTLSSKHYRQNLVRHINTVLFTAFAVYVYRDVVPLATFTLKPLDHGPKIAVKVALLAFTAVVIPLLTPRQYIPVDPQNPQKEINPEQTASIGAFALYFFLDKIIWSAYRQSRLDEDELYALCDTDTASFLQQRSFKHLDVYSGARKRYLFFGLMRVYWREFSIILFLVLLRPLAEYASPFAMSRLLEFMETRDQVDIHVIRPWVWIALLGLSHVASSLLFQLQIFINTRTLVRTESILTQLILAHSLRIRMKAEVSETKPADGNTTASTKDDKESQKNLTGKINNLITSDLTSIIRGREFLAAFVYHPAQIVLGIYFVYTLLGSAVWVGVASIVLLTPLPGFVAQQVRKTQEKRMTRTDARISSVSEGMPSRYFLFLPFMVPAAVNVLRMVKLFGWETQMCDRILDKREEELVWIRQRRLLDLANNLVAFVIPIATMVFAFGAYTLILKQPLTASKVFSSMTAFDLLRDSIETLTGHLNRTINGKVSLDRVDDFLKKTELLDEFSADASDYSRTTMNTGVESELVGFRNATFSWHTESDGSLSPSQRQFQLRIPDELLFERGKINLVVGPTGCGKTSLLMALLGEMHFRPSSSESWFNLPRSGGVGYAAQESWVLNETIRDNVTFATPYDEARYKKVLYQCALEPDLALFQAGDQTEVGEKGGQKARLTLARAVYSKAAILLLDDVFAALDVHTAQHIVNNLFRGELIADRTVILVTHNLALTRPIADYIVTFGSDGRIQAQGTVSEITSRGPVAAQIRANEEALDKQQAVVDLNAPEDPQPNLGDGKLIVAEEVQLGHVSASALAMYFNAMGGKRPGLFFTLSYGGLFISQAANALQTWVLGYWAAQYEDRPASEVDVVANLTLFIATAVIATATVTVVFLVLLFGQLRASRVIHKNLIESVLTAPLRWLDITPVSRIITRATNDVRAVDDELPEDLWPLATSIVAMLVRLGAVVIYAPIFFFPGVAIGAFGAWVGQIYIAGQLAVKRFQSNNRAPVIAHFVAAMAGLVSIRAFGAQNKIKSQSISKIDRYTRSARNFYNLNRWVGVRVDILAASLTTGLAAYLVYVRPTSAGDAGFAITMCVTATQLLLLTVRIWNDFEIEGNSLERLQGYINIEHEKSATAAGTPPAYWPSSGDLVVENLTARYSDDGPAVLHGISFHVRAGERVGIVGRTGSGKSSLTLSLLRCIPTEGSVRYDGLDTSELNLDALRSSITIIPQVPELLSGTLRSNLDPFGQYDDAELNAALRASGLFSLQEELDEGRITLDSAIAAGASNLSVGQRQIFALARAIVRKSKILILDEATSAIDYKTDSIIQTSLREELGKDVSLLTVAHRLQTIMDSDKIMVLEAGRIVEYDTPRELLRIEGGKLRALVDESRDREVLYAMAGI